MKVLDAKKKGKKLKKRFRRGLNMDNEAEVIEDKKKKGKSAKSVQHTGIDEEDSEFDNDIDFTVTLGSRKLKLRYRLHVCIPGGFRLQMQMQAPQTPAPADLPLPHRQTRSPPDARPEPAIVTTVPPSSGPLHGAMPLTTTDTSSKCTPLDE